MSSVSIIDEHPVQEIPIHHETGIISQPGSFESKLYASKNEKSIPG